MRSTRAVARANRKRRVRKKVYGTPERPRLSVYGSLNHIYAQIIDDVEGTTLVFVSTLDKELKGSLGHGGNVDSSKKVGDLVAKRALEKGIEKVVFDRGGFKYHGRIKALADAARERGLKL